MRRAHPGWSDTISTYSSDDAWINVCVGRSGEQIWLLQQLGQEDEGENSYMLVLHRVGRPRNTLCWASQWRPKETFRAMKLHILGQEPGTMSLERLKELEDNHTMEELL